jgi:hypothetical protein
VPVSSLMTAAPLAELLPEVAGLVLGGVEPGSSAPTLLALRTLAHALFDKESMLRIGAAPAMDSSDAGAWSGERRAGALPRSQTAATMRAADSSEDPLDKGTARILTRADSYLRTAAMFQKKF